MSKSKTIAIVFLAALAGFMAGRLGMSPRAGSLPAQSPPARTSSTHDSMPGKQSESSTAAVAPSNSPTPNTAINTSSPSAPARQNSIKPPYNMNASEADENLIERIREPLSGQGILSRAPKPDGSYSTRESAQDGGTIDKVYNSQGALTGEMWTEADGGTISRAYYDSGSIKGFADKETDGSATAITFTQSGLFKARSDTLPDGDVISTEYDDEGQVINRVRKTRDGRYIKL